MTQSFPQLFHTTKAIFVWFFLAKERSSSADSSSQKNVYVCVFRLKTYLLTEGNLLQKKLVTHKKYLKSRKFDSCKIMSLCNWNTVFTCLTEKTSTRLKCGSVWWTRRFFMISVHPSWSVDYSFAHTWRWKFCTEKFFLWSFFFLWLLQFCFETSFCINGTNVGAPPGGAAP